MSVDHGQLLVVVDDDLLLLLLLLHAVCCLAVVAVLVRVYHPSDANSREKQIQTLCARLNFFPCGALVIASTNYTDGVSSRYLVSSFHEFDCS